MYFGTSFSWNYVRSRDCDRPCKMTAVLSICFRFAFDLVLICSHHIYIACCVLSSHGMSHTMYNIIFIQFDPGSKRRTRRLQYFIKFDLLCLRMHTTQTLVESLSMDPWSFIRFVGYSVEFLPGPILFFLLSRSKFGMNRTRIPYKHTHTNAIAKMSQQIMRCL